MSIQEIKTVGVIGAGVMGNGIALVAAQTGWTVLLYDITETALQKGISQIQKQLSKAVELGKLSEEQKQTIFQRIQGTTDLQAVQAELIIEAVLENLSVKHDIFKTLEKVNSEKTILTTNTSSIPITQIGSCLQHKSRFAGMHFFNPANLMKLVEVIPGADTANETTQIVFEVAKRMGKVPVIVKDAPGFIVNRVARHYYLESLNLLEESIASIEEIDAILEATGFKMGPFKLMDLIGVDTNHEVTKSLYASFFQANRFRPSRIQQQKVDAGHFGRKTGKGFYSY
ncbi:MAG: 3-hydroxyacyl-CoA dehydrogenase NAD-binding domain-containing protein [Bacteroidia bacterium]|nr:3-hydroxyacyl-CoA dehydrogenase NAD-binding domain-containing protein [Bacteroidia bacterium]